MNPGPCGSSRILAANVATMARPASLRGNLGATRLKTIKKQVYQNDVENENKDNKQCFLTNRSESWISVDSSTILLPRLPLEKKDKPCKNKRETKKVRRKREKSQPSQSALLTQDIPEQPARLIERKGACSKTYNQ